MCSPKAALRVSRRGKRAILDFTADRDGNLLMCVTIRAALCQLQHNTEITSQRQTQMQAGSANTAFGESTAATHQTPGSAYSIATATADACPPRTSCSGGNTILPSLRSRTLIRCLLGRSVSTQGDASAVWPFGTFPPDRAGTNICDEINQHVSLNWCRFV